MFVYYGSRTVSAGSRASVHRSRRQRLANQEGIHARSGGASCVRDARTVFRTLTTFYRDQSAHALPVRALPEHAPADLAGAETVVQLAHARRQPVLHLCLGDRKQRRVAARAECEGRALRASSSRSKTSSNCCCGRSVRT